MERSSFREVPYRAKEYLADRISQDWGDERPGWNDTYLERLFLMRAKLHFTLLAAFGILALGCSSAPKRAYVPPTPKPAPPPVVSVTLPQSRLPVTPNYASLPEQPRFDPIQDVVEKAEAAFERGRKSYAAGHLETAKADFNIAVNTILQSPVTAREDRRIQSAFDSLVERIHSYEIEALRAGDGFDEPGFLPAPIDELQQLTFQDDAQGNQLVAGAATPSRSAIPLVINSQVSGYINYFTNGKGKNTLQAAMQRSGRYRDMIFSVFDEEKVPRELIYLAQAESGFQPRARSHKAALGMWQFISGTGKLYGLTRSWWEDERLNPEEATRAAARHLGDLYDQFGDWYLAMAAYNCGQHCVARAVERTGFADFWELSRRRALPKETRNYVPLIIALTIVASNPEKYGVSDLAFEPTWTYDTVTVNEPIDLRLVAEIVGSNLQEIRELNPSLLRNTTPKLPEFRLRLPLATRDIFLKRVAMIPPEKRVYWRWHTVRHGETLSGIAKNYKISVQSIAQMNSLDPSQPLREADDLVIPVGNIRPEREPAVARGASNGVHIVRRNETMSLISRRYGLSTQQLLDLNNLSETLIRVGQRLVVSPEAANGTGILAVAAVETRMMAASAPSGARRIVSTTSATSKAAVSTETTGRLVHRVQKGESLWQIAANYNTTVEILKKNNRHLKKNLQVGDSVYIPAER